MLKLLGAVLLTAGAAAMGFSASAQLGRRVKSLRALLGGKIDALELHDVKHRALIRGEGKVTYPLLIGDRTAYFCEENLFEMENFVLDRLFGRKKANQCLSITINGEADLQMSVGVWVNE